MSIGKSELHEPFGLYETDLSGTIVFAERMVEAEVVPAVEFTGRPIIEVLAAIQPADELWHRISVFVSGKEQADSFYINSIHNILVMPVRILLARVHEKFVVIKQKASWFTSAGQIILVAWRPCDRTVCRN